jgi:hypothetical protein
VKDAKRTIDLPPAAEAPGTAIGPVVAHGPDHSQAA